MKDYPSILYVEDDMMSRYVMQILLVDEMKLQNVLILEDSSSFEERITSIPFSPSIVFLDIHVQPLDGFAMLEILRGYEAYANTPIVALTASVMNEEVAQLREAGFNGVIPKPIDIDTFPSVMGQLLSGEEVWRVLKA